MTACSQIHLLFSSYKLSLPFVSAIATSLVILFDKILSIVFFDMTAVTLLPNNDKYYKLHKPTGLKLAVPLNQKVR